MVAGVCAAAGVLGWLVGRLVRTDGSPRLPLGRDSGESFWRDALPWPAGVQEDTDIAWHVPRDDPPPLPTASGRHLAGDRPVPPTYPQRRYVGR
jgi:hypothetical protein